MDTPHIILATNNAHKKKEFSHAFNTQILSPNDLNIVDFDPIETGETFEQNAMIKAEALYNILQTYANMPTSYIIVADDSGLCVDILGGKPGIFSARYAHLRQGYEEQGNASDSDNRHALIEALQEHGVWGSKAFFQCSIAYIVQQDMQEPHTQQGVVTGKCHGIVATKELGAHGFGYDSLFYKDFGDGQNIDFSLQANEAQKKLDSLEHSIATLPLEQKMNISHRGQAILKLQEALRKYTNLHTK